MIKYNITVLWPCFIFGPGIHAPEPIDPRTSAPHRAGPEKFWKWCGFLIWTSSYLMNQTHIATIGSNEIYRFDEKDIRPFFPVNFIDLYRLKTVAAGNYEADTELKYRIGSYLTFFWDPRIALFTLFWSFISETDFNGIEHRQQRCLCITTELGSIIIYCR